MEKRTQFPVGWLPYALVAPQLAITIVFFIWPAGQALWQSMLVQDAFGTHTEFVWFENFQVLFADETYLESFRVTAKFAALVASLGLSISLVLAACCDHVLRGAKAYQTLIIWPYAVLYRRACYILAMIGLESYLVRFICKFPISFTAQDILIGLFKLYI